MSGSVPAATVAILRRLERELRQQLNTWPQKLRHVFCVLAEAPDGDGLPKEIEGFEWWLRLRDRRGDRYEYPIFADPFIASTSTAKLQEFFIASAGTPRNAGQQLLDVVEGLNLVIATAGFKIALPQFGNLERVAQVVYQITKQEPAAIGCKPDALYFRHGAPLPIKGILESIDDWQTSIPPGRHFIWLDRDVRRCLIDAIDWICLTAAPEAVSQSGDGSSQATHRPSEPGSNGQPDKPKQPALPPADNTESRGMWLARAMLLVRDHPDWSNAEIARQVSKHPSTLARSLEYQVAAALARGSKADHLRGHIVADPKSGLRDVEAIATEAASHDEKSDRGQPVAGTKYVREYCSECDEPIRVTQDQVGQKPVCNNCET